MRGNAPDKSKNVFVRGLVKCCTAHVSRTLKKNPCRTVLMSIYWVFNPLGTVSGLWGLRCRALLMSIYWFYNSLGTVSGLWGLRCRTLLMSIYWVYNPLDNMVSGVVIYLLGLQLTRLRCSGQCIGPTNHWTVGYMVQWPI